MTYLVAFRLILFAIFVGLFLGVYRTKIGLKKPVDTQEEVMLWLGIILTASGFAASFAHGAF